MENAQIRVLVTVRANHKMCVNVSTVGLLLQTAHIVSSILLTRTLYHSTFYKLAHYRKPVNMYLEQAHVLKALLGSIRRMATTKLIKMLNVRTLDYAISPRGSVNVLKDILETRANDVIVEIEEYNWVMFVFSKSNICICSNMPKRMQWSRQLCDNARRLVIQWA